MDENLTEQQKDIKEQMMSVSNALMEADKKWKELGTDEAKDAALDSAEQLAFLTFKFYYPNDAENPFLHQPSPREDEAQALEGTVTPTDPSETEYSPQPPVEVPTVDLAKPRSPFDI